MPTLKPDECRVLGVLVEKAQTTPQQYPLTLNSLTSGCNQKNNRLPVVEWDEDRAYDALDSLRAKGLVHEVNMTGSRVPKFRHTAREILAVDTPQLVVLAELLLRGPQSAGEIRSNASRMHPIESLEVLESVLSALMAREPPVVRELAPTPGTRARRYAQLLCPELHRLDAGPVASATMTPSAAADPTDAAPVAALTARMAALEALVHRLESAVEGLSARLD